MTQLPIFHHMKCLRLLKSWDRESPLPFDLNDPSIIKFLFIKKKGYLSFNKKNPISVDQLQKLIDDNRVDVNLIMVYLIKNYDFYQDLVKNLIDHPKFDPSKCDRILDNVVHHISDVEMCQKFIYHPLTNPNQQHLDFDAITDDIVELFLRHPQFDVSGWFNELLCLAVGNRKYSHIELIINHPTFNFDVNPEILLNHTVRSDHQIIDLIYSNSKILTNIRNEKPNIAYHTAGRLGLKHLLFKFPLDIYKYLDQPRFPFAVFFTNFMDKINPWWRDISIERPTLQTLVLEKIIRQLITNHWNDRVEDVIYLSELQQ